MKTSSVHKVLAPLGAMISLIMLFTMITVPSVQAAERKNVPEEVNVVLSEINKFRTDKGLNPVKVNLNISNVSLDWSVKMADEDFFFHNPNYAYDRRVAMGWKRAGEIIAYNSGSPAGLVQQWINSPGHNAIMSTSTHTVVGIGLARNSDRLYGTVNFFSYDQNPPHTYDEFTDNPPALPEPTPEPTPTPTPTTEPSVEPTPVPTPTTEPSVEPTPTQSPSPVPTPTQSPSPVPTPTQSPSPKPVPSPTVKPSPTPTVKPSPSPTPTVKPSPSPTPTVKPSPTPKPKPAYKVKGSIGKYYNSKGGVKKFGKPLGNEKRLTNPSGYVQSFEKGSIYHSSKGGTRFVAKGSIMNKWKKLRYEKGELGFPRGDQYKLKNASEARAQNFQNGTIVYSKKGTFVVKGAIGSKWKKMGWAKGYLKRPISDQKCGLKNGGCFQKFEGGSIHWSKKTGAHPTKKNSKIQKKWGALKYERGSLGYPKSGQYSLAGNRTAYAQNFQKGTIYTSSKGTYVAKGSIDKKYRSLSRTKGYLKAPISNEKCGLKSKGCFQRFQGGSIYWSKSSGAHAVKKSTAIGKRWVKQRSEKGKLGYPTSGEYKSGKRYTKQKFQGGTITYNKKTKKTSISYKKKR